jgi:class 3 adenylate cyclase
MQACGRDSSRVADLPTGTVTLLFTDVERSTRLLNELGAEAYDETLAEHRRALREAFAQPLFPMKSEMA